MSYRSSSPNIMIKSLAIKNHYEVFIYKIVDTDYCLHSSQVIKTGWMETCMFYLLPQDYIEVYLIHKWSHSYNWNLIKVAFVLNSPCTARIVLIISPDCEWSILSAMTQLTSNTWNGENKKKNSLGLQLIT